MAVYIKLWSLNIATIEIKILISRNALRVTKVNKIRQVSTHIINAEILMACCHVLRKSNLRSVKSEVIIIYG